MQQCELKILVVRESVDVFLDHLSACRTRRHGVATSKEARPIRRGVIPTIAPLQLVFGKITA